MRLEGAYAQYLVIDETNLLIPPAVLEPWVACLTEPTATALHAVALVERINYRPMSEQTCLVIGGGAIGLLTALMLAAKGCCNIDLAETNALRRSTIEQQSVARVFDPSTQSVPNEKGYDVVLIVLARESLEPWLVPMLQPVALCLMWVCKTAMKD